MALSTARRAQLTSDLEYTEAQLDKARESYSRALENMDVEEYRFNSGEGSQQTRSQSIARLQSVIDSLIADRDKIQRKLNGRGIVSMNLRRKW